MSSPTNEAESIEVEVYTPQQGDYGCEGKPDDRLAGVTKVALEMFGELAELKTRDRVEILMVRHGWKQADVARALGISWQAVSKHWANIAEELDFEDLPKRQRAMLARQYDAMFHRAAGMDDESRGIPIALKALELKAKLLGLNLEAQTAGGDITPYKTPDEIADAVRAQVLAIHGRSELIEANPANPAKEA